MKHLTPLQLLEYRDGLRGEEAEHHLPTCQECSEKLRALQRVEDSIRRIPLEKVSPGFADQVMRRLGVSESPSIGWTIFKNLAPLLALTIVTGIVGAALQLTGAYQSPEVQQSSQSAQSIYNQMSGRMATGIETLNGWLRDYVSFAFTESTTGLTIFLVAVFALTALLDKFLLMPLLRKRG